MTREEHKEYNAENYPASVLTWLNDATDRAYDDFESRTCENCKYLINHGYGWAECRKFGKEFQQISFGCNKWEAR